METTADKVVPASLTFAAPTRLPRLGAGTNVTAPTRQHKFSPRDKRVKPFVTALKAFRGSRDWCAVQDDAAAYFLQPPTK
jgi:hypothetical protein